MFTPSLYIDTFFLEEREGVYFKLKYLLHYLQLFLLYPKTFLVNWYEQITCYLFFLFFLFCFFIEYK